MNNKKEIKNANLFHESLFDNNYKKAKKLLKRDFKIDRRSIHFIFEQGSLIYFDLLLKYRDDIYHLYDNYALRLACEKGHTKIVKLLLENKYVDPSAANNEALCLAAESGYLDIVKLLLDNKEVDPRADLNYPINYAFMNGHLDVAYLLWKREEVKLSIEKEFYAGDIVVLKQIMKSFEVKNTINNF
jgi:ankyrin repeat protein